MIFVIDENKIFVVRKKYEEKDHKNIARHAVHVIVSWPNPKQWLMIHISGFDDNKMRYKHLCYNWTPLCQHKLQKFRKLQINFLIIFMGSFCFQCKLQSKLNKEFFFCSFLSFILMKWLLWWFNIKYISTNQTLLIKMTNKILCW